MFACKASVHAIHKSLLAMVAVTRVYRKSCCNEIKCAVCCVNATQPMLGHSRMDSSIIKTLPDSVTYFSRPKISQILAT